jgi:uncharacterized membrane protein
MDRRRRGGRGAGARGGRGLIADPALRILSARRAATSLAAGAVPGVAVAIAGEPALTPVVAWTVAAAIVLAWVWRLIWPEDAAGTKRLAEAEGRTHTTDAGVLMATVASFGAVASALLLSSRRHGATATAAVLLSLVAIVLSWSLANTIFALKYARLYYLDEDGGMDFAQPDPPAYSDFAYVAFAIGMTFGPPEGTAPTTTVMRRAAFGHALLSYVFGTGILAAAINLVANLG